MQEFHELYQEWLRECYSGFFCLCEYAGSLRTFLQQLERGSLGCYPSIKSMLEDLDGAQLLFEAIYILGVVSGHIFTVHEAKFHIDISMTFKIVFCIGMVWL
eukprot:SAG31_NODE_878_length_11297_cov_3.770714_9_plen_102_part_00